MASLRQGAKSAALSPFLIFIFFAPVLAQPQVTEDRRSIWPPEYRQVTKSRNRPARYHRTAKSSAAEPVSGPGMLGITLWRLRPSLPSDQARILVTKNNSKSYWTPERVSADTGFAEGQLVRLSVEVPRTGYLYVVDRELYADGSSGDPYLIFPLSPSGDPYKALKARVVELPGPSEDTPGFEFHSFRKDGPPQTAELLTFIIAPNPLEELRFASPDGSPVKLSRALAGELESRWGTQAEQLELEGGAGRAYSLAERNATRNKPLSNTDPLPQTVFRLKAKPGSPYAIKLSLKIGK